MRIPEIIAHRGYTTRYPENTLASVEAAIDAGVKYVEVDVQLSADGVPVLFHDRTLERMCGTQGAVHEKTIKELRKLRASEPSRFNERYAKEPVATLQAFCELLACYPHVTAFVEVKRVAIERFGGEAVLEAVSAVVKPIRMRCVLISFSIGLLELIRRDKPDLPIGVVVDMWEQLRDPEIKALRPDYVFCDVEGLPETGVLYLQRAAKLVIYEVADGAQALKLAERGADFIESFACAEMLEYFRRSPGP